MALGDIVDVLEASRDSPLGATEADLATMGRIWEASGCHTGAMVAPRASRKCPNGAMGLEIDPKNAPMGGQRCAKETLEPENTRQRIPRRTTKTPQGMMQAKYAKSVILLHVFLRTAISRDVFLTF